MDEAHLKCILDAFYTNESLSQVAKKFSLGTYIIRDIWKKSYGDSAYALRNKQFLKRPREEDKLEALKAFNTDESHKHMAIRLGMSPNTIKAIWVEAYGLEAIASRGKRLHAKGTKAYGLSRRGGTCTKSYTDVPCKNCGALISKTRGQISKNKKGILCATCASLGKDFICPVCGLCCGTFAGMCNHIHRTSDKAHTDYLDQKEQKLWEGGLEDRDFVQCKVCGFRAKSLAGHIRKHQLDAAGYRGLFPGAIIISAKTEEKKIWSNPNAHLVYFWTAEDLLKYADDQGRVVVAEAAINLKASVTTVLIHCKRLGLPTRNSLSWQHMVLGYASKALSEDYVWEWSDPRIINEKTNWNYRFDGFFPKSKIIIEAHGDQHFRYSEAWHGSLEYFHELRKRDADKKALAEALGYTVYTIKPPDHIEDPEFWVNLLAGVPQETHLFGKVFSNLRSGGFPHIEPRKDELRKSLTRLLSICPFTDIDGVIHPYSTQGTQACGTFFPNRYKAHYNGAKSVFEAWYDDKDLGKALQLQLDSGHPTTPLRVIRALSMYHHTPSIFRPVVAKHVYQLYGNSGTVWDPCAGYGGRILGAVAAGISKYIGTDIELETCQGNQLIIDTLGYTNDYTIIQTRAEEFDPGIELDLVFTSPPYFNLETYGEASKEVYGKYGSARGWVQKFLAPVITMAFQRIRHGGHLVLNLPEKPIKGVRLDLEARIIAKNLGFIEGPTLKLPVRTYRGEFKKDPILVWSKI